MLNDLQTLRISLARIAQSAGVETEALPVLDKEYTTLHYMATTQERGWNTLASTIIEKLEEDRG